MALPLKRKLTYIDYTYFPDDGCRHELIAGAHIMSPSPNIKHQLILKELLVQLSLLLMEKSSAVIIPAPCDVLLSDFDVVQPDLVVVLNKNKGLITEKNIQGAPDLVVEILSPSTEQRDMILKKGLYEQYGVAEYWVIDPAAETVRQFVCEQGCFQEIGIFTKTLSCRVLPDVILELRTIFPKP